MIDGDSRGVLRRWYDGIVAGGRFAELLAWPSGCIDTHWMRFGLDPDPAVDHVEVDSAEAMLASTPKAGSMLEA